ncbi:MAG TPA: class I poly(R)-hydroxyalkanoic acid synthase, partial [Alphaproteobacteria bacterium]
LEGNAMKVTFNMLRANDLIWTFVVNNYLLGREPFPFDLLYWNSDSTNLPAAMHTYYLRHMYINNDLVKPGAISVCGVPVDISTIDTPAYFLSTREDHIAPWAATLAGATHLKGPITFTLAASGHIAGVVNPPASGKYCYWTAPEKNNDPDAWLKQAKEHAGSWWPHWQKWIEKQDDSQVPAVNPAAGPLKSLVPAPGTYVKKR